MTLARIESLTGVPTGSELPALPAHTHNSPSTSNSCPVRFYDRQEVIDLLRQAGWGEVTVHRLSRDYLVEARAG